MTYRDVLPIWWSFFWRATVVGFLVGALVGAVFGAGAAVVGQPENAESWGSIAGYAVSVPVSLWAFRVAIRKHLPPTDTAAFE